MSLQYSFGFESPTRPLPPASAAKISSGRPTNKLLLMAKPDEGTAARIARAADELAVSLVFTGKLVRPALLHFTLHHIGLFLTVPRSIVDAVGKCGDTVRIHSFTVQ
ncbi:MAG: hypothetical protein AB7O88_16990 [Reyranellaceae bacterium]